MNLGAPGIVQIPAAVTGRTVILRPVTQDDALLLFRWRLDPLLHMPNWPRRTPSLEDFMSEVERQVRQSIILLIVDKATGQHAGFVQAYNMNLEAGTAFVACSTDEAYRNTTVAIEAKARFVDFLFRAYGFRKVCVDVAEFQLAEWNPLMSAGLAEEGRFHDHLWLEGRHSDVLRLAVFQDKWIDERERAFLLLGVQEEVANLLTRANSASEEP